MLTATQMIPAVGQEVFVRTDVGPVVCRVRDVRNRFGKVDLFVIPSDERGGGECTWVTFSRVCRGMTPLSRDLPR